MSKTLTLTHTTKGWFAETGGVAWFHHRKTEDSGVDFGAVCLSEDDFHALGDPEAITITIEASE